MVRKAGNQLPKVEFRYSWVYDQEHKLRFTDPLYPDGNSIREYIAHIHKDWKPRQRILLNSISKISGLPWREDTIVCYVVGRGVPMSDPLTMPVYVDRNDLFIWKLVHELVEKMLMNTTNLDIKREFWEEMLESLSEEGVKVAYMIPVNAIYREIHDKYSKKMGGVKIESLMTRNLDYQRAWEIVNTIGTESIIERFRRGLWE